MAEHLGLKHFLVCCLNALLGVILLHKYIIALVWETCRPGIVESLLYITLLC